MNVFVSGFCGAAAGLNRLLLPLLCCLLKIAGLILSFGFQILDGVRCFFLPILCFILDVTLVHSCYHNLTENSTKVGNLPLFDELG